MLGSSTLWAAEIALQSNSELVHEGYFVLSWVSTPPSSKSIVLQQSTTKSFSNPRQFSLPADGSITITGLTDGHYFFRAIQNNLHSNTVSIRVSHHSLQKAGLFFTIGLLLFAILLLTIFTGNARMKAIENAK